MDEINENKTTPKTSDTGLEYIREMVSRGFLKKNMIPSEEAEGFEELEKNGSLPEGVYPTTNGTKRAYCHVENTAPDMTGEEIDRLIAMRKGSRNLRKTAAFQRAYTPRPTAPKGRTATLRTPLPT